MKVTCFLLTSAWSSYSSSFPASFNCLLYFLLLFSSFLLSFSLSIVTSAAGALEVDVEAGLEVEVEDPKRYFAALLNDIEARFLSSSLSSFLLAISFSFLNSKNKKIQFFKMFKKYWKNLRLNGKAIEGWCDTL